MLTEFATAKVEKLEHIFNAIVTTPDGMITEAVLGRDGGGLYFFFNALEFASGE